jgi:hypothetical protein
MKKISKGVTVPFRSGILVYSRRFKKSSGYRPAHHNPSHPASHARPFGKIT